MISPIVILKCYFDKRLGLAQGIFMSAFGIAQFIWSPLAEYLLRAYSLSGTLLIIAGIQLHGCILGALMQPWSDHASTKNHSVCDKKSADSAMQQ